MPEPTGEYRYGGDDAASPAAESCRGLILDGLVEARVEGLTGADLWALPSTFTDLDHGHVVRCRPAATPERVSYAIRVGTRKPASQGPRAGSSAGDPRRPGLRHGRSVEAAALASARLNTLRLGRSSGASTVNTWTDKKPYRRLCDTAAYGDWHRVNAALGSTVACGRDRQSLERGQ